MASALPLLVLLQLRLGESLSTSLTGLEDAAPQDVFLKELLPQPPSTFLTLQPLPAGTWVNYLPLVMLPCRTLRSESSQAVLTLSVHRSFAGVGFKLRLLDNLPAFFTFNLFLAWDFFVLVAVQRPCTAEPFIAVLASQRLFLAGLSPFFVELEQFLTCKLHRTVLAFQRNTT